MRLLAEEQKEIMKLIDQFDLHDRYAFVKRKGWVHIEVEGRAFAFHRKKTAQIIDGKFENKVQYFIMVEKSTQPVDGFAEVTEKLAKWLDEG